MDIIEKKYRNTPEGNKKYVKRLTDYINILLSKGRVLEAKYYFDKLYLLKPDHVKTILLGYKLSIKLFNTNDVSKFDKKLYNLKRSEEELVWFRLQYYYSVNNKKFAEECASYLLSKNTLKPEVFQSIFEICINIESYEVVPYLIKYMENNKLIFNERVGHRIKRIAIKKLIECFSRAKI